MKVNERERRDWITIPIILLIGFVCMIIAGQWALRFAPSWELNANMGSNLDPDSDFLTRRPSGFIEPVDPAILTEPVWINLFLTPGAQFSTRTMIPITSAPASGMPTSAGTPFATPTSVGLASATSTSIIPSPTRTFIYYPPASSSTPRPRPSATQTVSSGPTSTVSAVTSTATPTSTSAATASTPTYTPSPTASPTPSSTPTLTPTATPTPTNTLDPGEPDFGNPDGTTVPLGNGSWIEFNLSGFLLDGNSAWDAVYYEMEEASAAGKIHLGALRIDVYDETTAAWYKVYEWGDGLPDANASYNNGNSEPDGFPVDKSMLVGSPPLNTGIAIDIDDPSISQGGSVGDSITKIRITSFSNANCDVDSLQMLR